MGNANAPKRTPQHAPTVMGNVSRTTRVALDFLEVQPNLLQYDQPQSTYLELGRPHINTHPGGISKKTVKESTTFREDVKASPVVTLPYAPFITKGSSKIFKELDLRIVYSSGTSLRSLIGNPKDKIQPLEKSGIYEINCKDCNQKYIGQTRRAVSTRFKEHMANLRFNRIEKSSVAQHIFETDHNIDHTNVKLIRQINNSSSSRPSAASQEDLEAAASTSAEPQIIPTSDEDTEAVANANRQFQITAAREKAHLNLAKQAQRMKLASDSIHARVEIGENIIIPIPDVDRAKADLRNIIGVVLQMDEQGLHKIGTKYGILDKLYCRYVLFNDANVANYAVDSLIF
ncbi:giy-yig endonuclease superfamily [Holotrichia oblita]|uniref:Giy-yig endonuclease superfamily n=1 Tax=Holotrichia oblita TaxID=644536 RepID=A0ACB9TQC7_HOLOL|nr:giy-yig endonuclease superfamily [Holotrichia oblita]